MRAVPENNLAYPVLITNPLGGAASGFYLGSECAIYLVTAKHVIFDPKSGNLKSSIFNLMSYPHDPGEYGYLALEVNAKKLHAEGNIFAHQDRDVAAIKIFIKEESDKMKLVDGVGSYCTAKDFFGVTCVYHGFVKPLADVLVSNEVIVFGYPQSIGLKETPQFDYTKPLLRKGIISGKYEEQGTLILDCPIYPGDSGGLVLELENIYHVDNQGNYLVGYERKCRVVGVVSQFIPFDPKRLDVNQDDKDDGSSKLPNVHSGYSVVVSMDSVFQMLGLNL